MKEEISYFKASKTIEGVYGDFIVTPKDKREVVFYRISILSCGLFFSLGLVQWITNGSNQVWIYFSGLVISIGLCLRWIHIYLRPLHQALIFFWAIGCMGIGIIVYHFGLTNFFSAIEENPKWLFLVGPIFISLTGLGFKEFFCFRKIEAIGITIFIPIALIGHLTGLNNEKFTFSLLFLSSLLLLILGVRKFDLPAEADIGDKSVFDFLESQRKEIKPDIETS